MEAVTEHSPDAMHYTPDADGSGPAVPDPVAGLDPAEAKRVLAAAEQIDPDALADALDDDECAECAAEFTPTVEREFWCSEQCQRAWQLGQVDDPRGVDTASAERRARERVPFAAWFLRRQLALE